MILRLQNILHIITINTHTHRDDDDDDSDGGGKRGGE